MYCRLLGLAAWLSGLRQGPGGNILKQHRNVLRELRSYQAPSCLGRAAQRILNVDTSGGEHVEASSKQVGQ